jgi:GST-like protein
MALFPWLADIQGWVFYGDGTRFLALEEYRHVARWVAEVGARPAVKRGRIVNSILGEEGQFLKERHSAADVDAVLARLPA